MASVRVFALLSVQVRSLQGRCTHVIDGYDLVADRVTPATEVFKYFIDFLGPATRCMGKEGEIGIGLFRLDSLSPDYA